jgi:hypothetical protein
LNLPLIAKRNLDPQDLADDVTDIMHHEVRHLLDRSLGVAYFNSYDEIIKSGYKFAKGNIPKADMDISNFFSSYVKGGKLGGSIENLLKSMPDVSKGADEFTEYLLNRTEITSRFASLKGFMRDPRRLRQFLENNDIMRKRLGVTPKFIDKYGGMSGVADMIMNDKRNTDMLLSQILEIITYNAHHGLPPLRYLPSDVLDLGTLFGKAKKSGKLPPASQAQGRYWDYDMFDDFFDKFLKPVYDAA